MNSYSKKSEIVEAYGIDKLLKDNHHFESVSLPKRVLGLSSPFQITTRGYHWKLRNTANKFKTAF